MEEQMMNNDEIEIDLVGLFYALLKKIWIIILCFAIGLVGAGGFTYFFVTPLYESSSQIYILGNMTNISGVSLQLTNQLTVDFEILATSRPVINNAIAHLDKEYTYQEMVEMITISNPSDSSILKMTATSPDPQEAADIANAMADAVANRVAEVMDMDKPTTVEEAVVAEKPSSPSLVKNAAIGGLAGGFLSAAFFAVQFIMDDTIKNEDDVRKYLNMNTLAAIPKEKDKKKKKSA